MTRSLPLLLLSLWVGACGAAREGATEDDPTSGSEQPRQDVRSEAPPSDLPPAMRDILQAHDAARAEHCAPPLTWSDELAAAAAAWAAELASRGCPLEHSRSAFGENLFMATSGVRSPGDVVAAWVSERDDYDFASGGFSMETGHFTQVVWSDAERVGCATIECDGMDLWVCNYDPPGNIDGGYRDNVRPTTCGR